MFSNWNFFCSLQLDLHCDLNSRDLKKSKLNLVAIWSGRSKTAHFIGIRGDTVYSRQILTKMRTDILCNSKREDCNQYFFLRKFLIKLAFRIQSTA